MKKIGKISINPEKVIKNEELVNLRGGAYTDWRCCCGMGGQTYDCEWILAETCDAASAIKVEQCSFGGGCFCD